MSNKLFFICPDCCMEHYFREKDGNNPLFLTALGAVFDVNNLSYMKSIADLLQRETIKEIVIVNNISCRFMKSVIYLEKGFGTPAEEVLFKLMIDNYSALRYLPPIEQRKSLAAINVRHQINEIAKNELFQKIISEHHIHLKGLILTQKENTLFEIINT